MAQRHMVSLRASTPYRQWQDPAERYIHRWGRIVTYLMLDSQAPVSFQLEAAQHACRILSILSISVPASWLDAPAIARRLALPPTPMSLASSPVSSPFPDAFLPLSENDADASVPMVTTCAYFVLFRTYPDLRVFHRWGCLAYVRSEKLHRDRFQQHGEFAAVIGISGDRNDEWTYEVYLFRTRARVARRDILFREDIMLFAQGRDPQP